MLEFDAHHHGPRWLFVDPRRLVGRSWMALEATWANEGVVGAGEWVAVSMHSMMDDEFRTTHSSLQMDWARPSEQKSQRWGLIQDSK